MAIRTTIITCIPELRQIGPRVLTDVVRLRHVRAMDAAVESGAISREKHRKSHLHFGDYEIVDLVQRRPPNPSRVYSCIEGVAHKSRLVFYYFGAIQRIDGALFLRLQNSKKSKLKSFVSLSRIAKEVHSHGFRFSIVIIEGVFFGPDGGCESAVREISKIPELSSLILISHFDSHNAIRFEETIMGSYFLVNKLVPRFRFRDLVRFLQTGGPEKLQVIEYGKSGTLNFTCNSFGPPHRLWMLHSNNLGSSNRGSREDGVNEIRYYLGDHEFQTDTANFLRYFAAADPSQHVRKAAKGIMPSRQGQRIRTAINPTAQLADFMFPKMKQIGEGFFKMGSSIEEDNYSLKEEQPIHSFFLQEFSAAVTPVTNKQWANYCAANNIRHNVGNLEEDELKPVTLVNWYEAVQYTMWLTESALHSGQLEKEEEFRLPTEAEWEKAARGPHGNIYPWGNKFKKSACNYREHNSKGPMEVGSFSPDGNSIYGLQDMAGNVWEWTLSNWGRGGTTPEFRYPYAFDDGREDVFASNDVRRVVRGGAFYYFDYCLRCSTRNLMYPDTRHSGGGFRVVKSRRKFFSNYLES